MSATTVLACAVLGSTINFSDGAPRPPARFRRKVQAWERHNGSGLLTMRASASQIGERVSPPYFSLRTAVYSSSGVTVLVINKIFDANSTLAFEITPPPAGSVQVVTGFGDREELHHLAADAGEAASWIRAHGYRDARLVQLLEGGGSAELSIAA